LFLIILNSEKNFNFITIGKYALSERVWGPGNGSRKGLGRGLKRAHGILENSSKEDPRGSGKGKRKKVGEGLCKPILGLEAIRCF
jgi:hypothetical protein